jgi:TetR/AcrR family transcriptional repressor of mexJK operon
MTASRPTKKASILHAATALFLDKGFQDVSIRNITEKAGCSRETVYRYYSNKEDIFAGAIKSQMEAYLETMETLTMGGSSDLRQGLINWSVSLIVSVTADNYIRFRRLIISEIKARPEHGELYYDLTYHQGTKAVTEFFRQRQNEGSLKPVDPDRLAKYFVGMLLYELVHLRVLGVIEPPSKAEAQRLAEEAVDDFLTGYGISAELANE